MRKEREKNNIRQGQSKKDRTNVPQNFRGVKIQSIREAHDSDGGRKEVK